MSRLGIMLVVRRFCLECQGDSPAAVQECADHACALWECRLGKSPAEFSGVAESDDTRFVSSFEGLSPGPVSGADADSFAAVAPVPSNKEEALTPRLVSKSAQSRLAARARAAARRPVLRAVRRHCLCCATSREDVRACAAREDCLLWSFRFGVLPETYRAVRQRFLRPQTLSLFESK